MHGITDAHLTAADLLTEASCLESLWNGLVELLVALDGGEPVAKCGGIVVTCALAMALNEGGGAEVLQARAC